MIEVVEMHKKDVLSADQAKLNVVVEPPYASNDFSVCGVIKHLSGKLDTTRPYGISTGSSSGLPRAIPSDVCVSSPVTAPANYSVLRTIGLLKHLAQNTTIPWSNTWSMMRLTFIRMGVS